jgi:hypothetical protein
MRFTKTKLIFVLGAGVISLCIICLMCGVIYNMTPGGKAKMTERFINEQTEKAKPTNTPKPSNTLSPSKTQKPSNTPKSTNTPRPTDKPSATVTPKPTKTDTPTITLSPTLSAAYELVRISSSVSPGDDAYAVIRTLPGETCAISYITPIGTTSNAKGLESQQAGDNGLCLWSWKIGTSTKAGTGSIIITANGLTQTYQIEIK